MVDGKLKCPTPVLTLVNFLMQLRKQRFGQNVNTETGEINKLVDQSKRTIDSIDFKENPHDLPRVFIIFCASIPKNTARLLIQKFQFANQRKGVFFTNEMLSQRLCAKTATVILLMWVIQKLHFSCICYTLYRCYLRNGLKLELKLTDVAISKEGHIITLKSSPNISGIDFCQPLKVWTSLTFRHL